jgi:hypothetical protein
VTADELFSARLILSRCDYFERVGSIRFGQCLCEMSGNRIRNHPIREGAANCFRRPGSKHEDIIECKSLCLIANRRIFSERLSSSEGGLGECAEKIQMQRPNRFLKEFWISKIGRTGNLRSLKKESKKGIKIDFEVWN